MEEAAFDDVHLSSNVGMLLLGGLKSYFEGRPSWMTLEDTMISTPL
jgi:hypothetical protein